MARPKRIDQTDLRSTVKETAWQQIAENGAAALSLRAIARVLGITAPAIYNYYPSRDELVTALIVDAYTSMADAQQAAFRAAPTDDHRARLAALGLEYRNWALSYPQRYQLIFGTPIPGYHAPHEITSPAAGLGMLPLINCLDAAHRDGRLRDPVLPAALTRQLEQWREQYPVSAVSVLFAALAIWVQVHGLVVLEIGTQYPPFLTEPGVFYQTQIDRMIEETLI